MRLVIILAAAVLGSSGLGSSMAMAHVSGVFICSNASNCAVQAKTLSEFQKLGGLGACGVMPGESTVKVVDRNGKLVGYRCESSPYQPGN